jgi:hypothetical protein
VEDTHESKKPARAAAPAVLGKYSDPLAQELLDFIALEAQLKGSKARTIASTVSACSAFLAANGYLTEAPVDTDFIERLKRALEQRSLQGDGFVLASQHADDRAYRSRLTSLVRAHEAPRTHFAGLLRERLESTGLSYARAASTCGRPRHWITNLLACRSGGVMGMTLPEATQLDQALGAKGKIFAGYVALTQRAAFEPVTPAMDQVLGRLGFAGQLASGRRGLGLTLDGLLDKVEQATGVRVLDSHLCQWEQGHQLPSQDMQNIVLALDDILGAGGKLVRAWKDEGPKKVLSTYALPYGRWPERLRAQFDGLVDYKGSNPEELARSDARGGDRWTGTASQDRCIEILERYLGFLVQERAFAVDSVSLTLTADWPLVLALFDFVRQRVGRSTYSQDALTMTSVLINLYGWYLPHLANQAAQESYWAGRLPTHAIGIDDTVPGVPQPYEIELLSFTERWNYQLYLARSRAREFLKGSHFEIGRLIGRAAPLLESETGMAEIDAVVEALVRKLPRRIRCLRAAIQCRRLVVAVLLLARCLRPGTLSVLRNEQVIVQSDRRVWLNLSEEQFKTRGKGGSELGILGQLPDCDHMHKMVRRYQQEARPILLGDAARRGNKDAGFFLTAACSHALSSGQAQSRAGGPLDADLVRRDARAILGYHPYAQRYLFATHAWRQGAPKQDIADVLGNTVPIVEKRYILETAASRTKQLNAVVMDLILGRSAPGQSN